MKLPNCKRLYDQEYQQEFKGLVGQLAVSINSGFEVLYEALNKKVSLRDNIACTVRDVNVVVDATGNPKNRTTFSLDSNSVVVDGCQVIRATNNTNSNTYPSNAVFISFTQTNSGVEINNVTGLQQNQQYTLRIVAYHQ